MEKAFKYILDGLILREISYELLNYTCTLLKTKILKLVTLLAYLKNVYVSYPPTLTHTAQKMKFYIKDFFSKCDQIRRKLWIWSHLLKKS